MSERELLLEAIEIISKGAEIMTLEQLSSWEGVRAFLETASELIGTEISEGK